MSPFDPQMAGGDCPPGLETVNKSVIQRVPNDWDIPPEFGTYESDFMTLAVAVVGPAIVKVLKSSLSWHISLLQGQILSVQAPLDGLEPTKYVKF